MIGHFGRRATSAIWHQNSGTFKCFSPTASDGMSIFITYEWDIGIAPIALQRDDLLCCFESDLVRSSSFLLAIIRPSTAGYSFVGRAILADKQFNFNRFPSLFLDYLKPTFGRLRIGRREQTRPLSMSTSVYACFKPCPLLLPEPSP